MALSSGGAASATWPGGTGEFAACEGAFADLWCLGVLFTGSGGTSTVTVLVGMLYVGWGSALGAKSGGGGGLSSSGGASACICDWFILCAQAHNSNGSSHANLLATSFMRPTPSNLLRQPAEDAVDPSPW